MIALVLTLVALAMFTSVPLTWAVIRISHRAGALDSAGAAGHTKTQLHAVPNTGGVAIFLTIAILLTGGLTLVQLGTADALTSRFPGLDAHLAGIIASARDALILLGSLLVLHLTGLFDDRRPLGPGIKLGVQLAVAIAIVIFTDTRLLTMLDQHVGGPWLSIVLSVAWLIAMTNAFNFLDNMDGLAGGIAVTAGSFLLAATILGEKWFVAATLAVLVGAVCGFLVFNFPWTRSRRASVFMGDGGSLVIGFLLGFLTMRTTWYEAGSGGWYAVFMPLVILAVPLYDFLTVTALRISQGKSPLVGDQQHFSHRLVKRGLSRRAAVLVICGCTAVTSIGGISLATLAPWQAAMVGVQTLLVLMVLGLYEYAARDQLSGSDA